MNQNQMFVKNRDLLEEKFHDIISENIKREREHKKDVFKKANAHAIVSFRRNEDELKKMENEDISDRTPILDILIEKWRYFNKHKKFMIEKYSKNANALREAFDKIMNYLGVESLDDIPDLLEKIEDQMSSIQMFISNLSIEIYSLEDNKKYIETQIKEIIERSSKSTNQRSYFIESKKDRIDLLKKKINDCKISLAEKEAFFQSLKDPTDTFLLQLESTFLADYVPNRIKINKDEWYNEENITAMLANIQDYLEIIEEIEKVSSNKEIREKDSPKKLKDGNYNNQINKELDKLKNDMKTKIDMLKISNNVYSSMKEKMNSSFDEAIKKMSEEIVKGTLSNMKVHSKDDTKKKVK